MTAAQVRQRARRVRRIPASVAASFKRIPPLVIDALIAVTVAATSLAVLIVEGGAFYGGLRGWSTYLLAAAMAAPLAARRRRPLEALLAIAILAILYQFADSPEVLELAQFLPLAGGPYAVSAYESRRFGLIVAFVAVELLLAIRVVSESATADVFGDTAWVLLSLAIGAVVRGRRERAQYAEQRRRDEARRLVDEERLRIAREVHDVVAHSIATISVQAGMAAHVFDSQPEQARAALQEIRQVSGEALHELRATLGVLRSASDAVDERAPTPNLDQFGDLVGRAEAAGIRVAVTTSGRARDLPAAIDLTACRVMQEALTNVVRHAGPGARATVAIAYRPEAVELRVTNGGPPPGAGEPSASAGSRLGLIGMRERVASVGGELWTGPRQEGGFEVRALLPARIAA